MGAEPSRAQCLEDCPPVGEHTAMQAHMQQDGQLYQPDTHTGAFPLSQKYSLVLSSALSTHAWPWTSKFRANRVCVFSLNSLTVQPWSLSPCLRLSQACRVKDPPLSLPFVLSGCFVRYDVRQGKTLLSFITNPNFLDFFTIILHDKHSLWIVLAVIKLGFITAFLFSALWLSNSIWV